MQNLRSILFRNGFFRINERKIQRWIENHEFEKLVFALENGFYRLRLKAAQGLGELGEKKAILYLEKTIEDSVQVVSVAAMDAIEKIDNSNTLKSKIETTRN